MDITNKMDKTAVYAVVVAVLVQQVYSQFAVMTDVTSERSSRPSLREIDVTQTKGFEITTLDRVEESQTHVVTSDFMSTESATEAMESAIRTETTQGANVLNDVTTGHDVTTTGDIITSSSSPESTVSIVVDEIIDLTSNRPTNSSDRARALPENGSPVDNKIDLDAKKSTRSSKPTKSTSTILPTKSTTLTNPTSSSTSKMDSTTTTNLPSSTSTALTSTTLSPSTLTSSTPTTLSSASTSSPSSSSTSTATTTKSSTLPMTLMPTSLSSSTTFTPTITKTTSSSTTAPPSTTSTSTQTTETSTKTSEPTTIKTTSTQRMMTPSSSTASSSSTTKTLKTATTTKSTTKTPAVTNVTPIPVQAETTALDDNYLEISSSTIPNVTKSIIEPGDPLDVTTTTKPPSAFSAPIIGLIIGVSLLAVILVAVIAALLCRRQKRRKKPPLQTVKSVEELKPMPYGSRSVADDDIAQRPPPIGQSDNFDPDSNSQRLPPIGQSEAKPEIRIPPSILKKKGTLKRSSRYIEPNPSLHIMLQDINIEYDALQFQHKNGAEDNTGFNYNEIAEDSGYEQFQAIYYNMSPIPRPIPLSRFPQYMQEKKSTPAILPQEYLGILQGLLAESWSGQHPSNAYKNKYSNVIAYDHSRVRLTTGIHESDHTYHGGYINANYISGFNHVKNMYIATQGPTSRTVNDFWLMVWEACASRIVMLCDLRENGRPLCTQYWPTGGQVVFGNISVSLSNTWTYQDHTVRLFTVTRGTSSRLIHQYHFNSWPDQGVPRNPKSVIQFRDKVKGHEPAIGPFVIHCNSGVGGTGVFIALDYLLDQANIEGGVDIVACVRKMRWARPNMVQNLEQYAYLYDCLLAALHNEANDNYLQLVVDKSVIPDDRRSILIEDSDARNLFSSGDTEGVYQQRTLPFNRSPVYVQTPVSTRDTIINRPEIARAQVHNPNSIPLPSRRRPNISREPSYETPSALQFTPNMSQTLDIRSSHQIPPRQGYSTMDHRVLATPSGSPAALQSPQSMTLQRAGHGARRPSEPVFSNQPRNLLFVHDVRRPSDPLPVIQMRRTSTSTLPATPQRPNQVQFDDRTTAEKKRDHIYSKIAKPDIYARVVKAKNKQNPVLPPNNDIYNLNTLSKNELKTEEYIGLNNPRVSKAGNTNNDAAGSNNREMEYQSKPSNISNLPVLY